MLRGKPWSYPTIYRGDLRASCRAERCSLKINRRSARLNSGAEVHFLQGPLEEHSSASDKKIQCHDTNHCSHLAAQGQCGIAHHTSEKFTSWIEQGLCSESGWNVYGTTAKRLGGKVSRVKTPPPSRNTNTNHNILTVRSRRARSIRTKYEPLSGELSFAGRSTPQNKGSIQRL